MEHKVYEHQLPSGAQGLVIDVPGSAVVCLRVTFHSGFGYADPKSYEVPHIMEHLLATVTQKHAEPNAFMIEAQKNGAYVNASTSADTNEYIYECAAFELDRMLDLIEEQVCEPLFADTPFKAEVGNVREELTRNTTQHMAVCTMGLLAQAAPELYRDYDERIGQLDGIRLEQLRKHYENTHTAHNARFYVAGHFPDQGKQVAERFERIFARLVPGRRLEVPHAIGRGSERPVVNRRDIDQLYYRTGHYFGELNEQERAAMAVLRMILVGGMGSRVLGEARRRGLAYSVGAAAFAEPGNSTFGFTGYVTPKNALELFEVMGRSMRDLAGGGVTPTELKAAVDLLAGTITRSTQTAGDVLQWYVDRYDEEGIIRTFEEGLGRLHKVTPSDITALAKQIQESNQAGASFVGRVDEDLAREYAAALN